MIKSNNGGKTKKSPGIHKLLSKMNSKAAKKTLRSEPPQECSTSGNAASHTIHLAKSNFN